MITIWRSRALQYVLLYQELLAILIYGMQVALAGISKKKKKNKQTNKLEVKILANL